MWHSCLIELQNKKIHIQTHKLISKCFSSYPASPPNANLAAFGMTFGGLVLFDIACSNLEIKKKEGKSFINIFLDKDAHYYYLSVLQ